MVEWSISLQPQEELAAFARFGNAVASLCVEKKGARACLKNHFRNLQAPLCGIFYPHSVAVARYAALIRIKSPTNWDSQLTKSLFQTRSKVQNIVSILEWWILWFWRESCPRVCCRGLCRQHRRCWFRYGGPGRRGDRRGWWRWRGHQRC